MWRSSLLRLAELARSHKPRHAVPDGNEEYLIYQTLLGVWPATLDVPDAELVGRVQQYMNKAIKEAKVHSSWINPDEEYDREIQAFVAALLDPATSAGFLAELASLREPITHAGYFNSLTQLVLKLGMPGVPDFYQGTELWDQSLVDPDNRRPVDFAARERLLAELRRDFETNPTELVNRLTADLRDGRIKMLVTVNGLHLRRRLRDVFGRGGYEAVATRGDHADRVIAFTRSHSDRSVVVACGRHFTAIAEPPRLPTGERWGNTVLVLPAGARFRDALTGRVVERARDGTVALRDAFALLPVIMLEPLA
jgi:(1->4)-alpha-D-glucan 1-alpha-D-glucosylmutase